MTNRILKHIGVARKSGRYPWGSGDNPEQRGKTFLGTVSDLKKKGLSDKEIYENLGMTSSEFRNRKSIAKNEQLKANESEVLRLKAKGMSNVAIGKQIGHPESYVRSLLDPATQERNNILNATTNRLKDGVAEKGYIDVGVGTEHQIGLSKTQLQIAVAKLEDEGYKVQYLKIEQVGNPGKFTSHKVLSPPNSSYPDLIKNQDKIGVLTDKTEDRGRTFKKDGSELPITSIDSKRVAVRYAEDGGSNADGMIYVRRGVPDVSLGNSSYIQARIAINGTHYLKGVAIYKDDLPKGIDLEFNTNKKSTGNKLDAMKPVSKDDPDNPFTSAVRPRLYKDADGKEKRSAINVVNAEGDWHDWSHDFSSQMLSKQTPALAKEQLGLTHAIKKQEYDEIMALTNPTIKKKLLESFADGADASSTLLQAASLPRTRNHVLIAIPKMKDSEVYAPNFKNGERVVLVRHPHGGPFEIPELTVNNNHREAKSLLGSAKDAIGINANVAKRLSGADFDGDTVLVIPNNHSKNDPRSVKTAPALKGLKDFDPQRQYPKYDGMKPMSARTKQHEMGTISNLITDMTIKGANQNEIARAVRHSMVVIDAEKHKLNYKLSAKDNNISGLKTLYQGKANAGASTLISLSNSTVRVNDRRASRQGEGGPVNPTTGKKQYTPTGRSYTNKQGKTIFNKIQSKGMLEVDDAHLLSSGVPMEALYADHANRLKAMANTARKSALETPRLKYEPSAKLAFRQEHDALKGKLNLALKNAPIERQAQLLATATLKAKMAANPHMDPSQLKTEKGKALTTARDRTGAKKQRIIITDREWTAIQAGAISNNFLDDILKNTDLDRVKELATPRAKLQVEGAKLARAKSMLAAGHTQSEIAATLGVPTSTLNDALGR